MRIRVRDVIELMAIGLSPEQILTGELPNLEPGDITACLLDAVEKLNHPVLRAA